MERDHWNLGLWRGIPVAMHWTFLLSCAWLFLWLGSVVATLIGSVALLLLFIAHEAGHVLMIKWRGMQAERIMINGLHGRTEVSYADAWNGGIVAWGGVLAQLAVLVVAGVASGLASGVGSPMAWTVLGPALFVFTKVNLFLMVIALLPIGPFDGAAAWALMPLLAARFKRRRSKAGPPKLSAQQQRDLEEQSQRAANELIRKVSRKAEEPRDGG